MKSPEPGLFSPEELELLLEAFSLYLHKQSILIDQHNKGIEVKALEEKRKDFNKKYGVENNND